MHENPVAHATPWPHFRMASPFVDDYFDAAFCTETSASNDGKSASSDDIGMPPLVDADIICRSNGFTISLSTATATWLESVIAAKTAAAQHELVRKDWRHCSLTGGPLGRPTQDFARLFARLFMAPVMTASKR